MDGHHHNTPGIQEIFSIDRQSFIRLSLTALLLLSSRATITNYFRQKKRLQGTVKQQVDDTCQHNMGKTRHGLMVSRRSHQLGIRTTTAD